MVTIYKPDIDFDKNPYLEREFTKISQVVNAMHQTFVKITDYEDLDVLNKIKNVDGTGSGLDADMLDGRHASTTPANNVIPVTDASGKIPSGFLPSVTSSFVWKLKNPISSAIKILPNAVSGGTLTTGTLPTNTILMFPFVPTENYTVTELGIYVSSGVSGSAVVGIYSSSSDRPSLLMGSVTLDVSSAAYKNSSVNISLTSGEVYWTAIASSVAPSLYYINAYNIFALIGAMNTSNQIVSGYTASGTTLPSSVTATGTVTGNIPAIYLR